MAKKSLGDVFADPNPDAAKIREYPAAPKLQGVANVRVSRDLMEVLKATKPDGVTLQAHHTNVLADALWQDPEARKLLRELGWTRKQTTTTVYGS